MFREFNTFPWCRNSIKICEYVVDKIRTVFKISFFWIQSSPHTFVRFIQRLPRCLQVDTYNSVQYKPTLTQNVDVELYVLQFCTYSKGLLSTLFKCYRSLALFTRRYDHEYNSGPSLFTRARLLRHSTSQNLVFHKTTLQQPSQSPIKPSPIKWKMFTQFLLLLQCQQFVLRVQQHSIYVDFTAQNWLKKLPFYRFQCNLRNTKRTLIWRYRWISKLSSYFFLDFLSPSQNSLSSSECYCSILVVYWRPPKRWFTSYFACIDLGCSWPIFFQNLCKNHTYM